MSEETAKWAMYGVGSKAMLLDMALDDIGWFLCRFRVEDAG